MTGEASGLLRMLSAGLLTTVQDLGRPGWAHLGISTSGAADTLALRAANRLAGNHDNAPALECTLLGPTLEFAADAVCALAGACTDSTLNGQPVSPFTSFRVAKSFLLRIGTLTQGARCYLAIAGGLAVAPVLGSASTHLLSHTGGIEGRALRKGDVLHFRSQRAFSAKIATPGLRTLWGMRPLRATRGPQWDCFDETVRAAFLAQGFTVSADSNRMGIRLSGEALKTPTAKMLTEGVSLGAIQVPPSGEPIILFVEQQTTGGFPKIANVAAADMHLVGQLRPRDIVRFEVVSFGEARQALLERERLLQDGIVPA